LDRKFHRATILIAEDNLDDIEITRRAFSRRRLSCDLVVARDGEEALNLLCEQPRVPDLVLLDINLPRLSGLQVLERIRANQRFAAMPIIMLSASAREEDVRESYEKGANTYIQKPVVFEQFLEALAVLETYWFNVARLPRML
jgi:two-component system response regulator